MEAKQKVQDTISFILRMLSSTRIISFMIKQAPNTHNVPVKGTANLREYSRSAQSHAPRQSRHNPAFERTSPPKKRTCTSHTSPGASSTKRSQQYTISNKWIAPSGYHSIICDRGNDTSQHKGTRLTFSLNLDRAQAQDSTAGRSSSSA